MKWTPTRVGGRKTAGRDGSCLSQRLAVRRRAGAGKHPDRGSHGNHLGLLVGLHLAWGGGTGGDGDSSHLLSILASRRAKTLTCIISCPHSNPKRSKYYPSSTDKQIEPPSPKNDGTAQTGTVLAAQNAVMPGSLSQASGQACVRGWGLRGGAETTPTRLRVVIHYGRALESLLRCLPETRETQAVGPGLEPSPPQAFRILSASVSWLAGSSAGKVGTGSLTWGIGQPLLWHPSMGHPVSGL